MPSYALTIGGLDGDLEALIEKVQHLPDILDKLVDGYVFPILSRHFDASGIKSHSGTLKAAVTKRGSKGNVVTHHGFGSVTVGVDYAQVPYARYVLEGNAPSGGNGRIYPKKAKALAFRIDGKLVIVKSVKAAPAHDVYFLTDAEVGELSAALTQLLAG